MTLSEEAQSLVAPARERAARPAHEIPIPELRELRRAAWVPTTAPIFESVDAEVPTRAGTCAVRLYRPSASMGFPIVMYLHGGGFVTGGLDMHDNFLRILSVAANVQIVSVDYRLAPEHPYPAAVEDGIDVWDWIQTSPDLLVGDTTRVAIAGDSAGGTLAFCVALLARDSGRKVPDAIVCAYGGGGMVVSNPELTTPMLSPETVQRYWSLYMPDPDAVADDPYCRPGSARSLSGLGPSLVISAEVDIVRDSVEDFGHRLLREGVDATVTRYDGVPHGFYPRVGILSQADRALEETVAFLARILG